MRRIAIIAAAVAIAVIHTDSPADCTCDDWMKRAGYCVDYIKTRIPAFPVPNNVHEIAALNNREIQEVAEGDVAVFDIGRYWHFAYVEKVHRDQKGNAGAIDVSEMNFGGHLSFDGYKDRWSPKNESEWKRAVCCGVTNTYGRVSLRKDIPLNAIKQIWSPNRTAAHRNVGI